MSIGLCGAQRVGKSTLAQRFADLTNITYIPSRAGLVFQNLGLEVNQVLTFEERMSVQEATLDAHIGDIRDTQGLYIADRTPLDMAAYALADWGKRATPEQSPRLMSYVNRCFQETNRLFSLVMIIQPGIEYVEMPGKPPNSESYQEIINMLLVAMVSDYRLILPRYIMSKGTTELDERVSVLSSMWGHMITNVTEQLAHEVRH